MRLRDDDGQMLVVTALSLTLLLGFLALAIDVGVLFHTKRSAQAAADAGAVAGALEYWYNGSTNVATRAGSAVSANGITLSYTPSLNTACPNSNQNCAVVNLNPNISSAYHNAAGYVQVITAKPDATFFLNLFHLSTVTVTASAIAGIAPNPACIVTTDPSSSNSFWIKGNSNITMNNCGVQVDSSSSSAVCVQGSATIQGPYVRINGQQSGGGQCGKNPGTAVYPNSGIASDPFAGTTGPNPNSDSSCGSGNTYTGTALNGTSTANMAAFNALTPKAWTDASGNSVNVTCFSQNVTLSNLTLTAGGGMYLFENGVNISNSVVVDHGTLDIYSGSFTNQNGALNISAPGSTYPSDPFEPIAIFQPAYNTTATCQDSSLSSKLNTTTCLQVQFGSSTYGSEDLLGYIYAPAATVYLQDQGGGVTAAGVVSADFYNNGQLNIKNSYNYYDPSDTKLSSVALVE